MTETAWCPDHERLEPATLDRSFAEGTRHPALNDAPVGTIVTRATLACGATSMVVARVELRGEVSDETDGAVDRRERNHARVGGGRRGF